MPVEESDVAVLLGFWALQLLVAIPLGLAGEALLWARNSASAPASRRRASVWIFLGCTFVACLAHLLHPVRTSSLGGFWDPLESLYFLTAITESGRDSMAYELLAIASLATLAYCTAALIVFAVSRRGRESREGTRVSR